MPLLPPELWWDILNISVHTPGLFETELGHSRNPFTFQRWDEDLLSDSIISTKLSISQVCRSWREIGVTLMYEHLFIIEMDMRRGNLSKIATIFEHHADGAGYGRSTKRVDVSIEGLSPEYLPALLRLLDLCHNIQVFDVFRPNVFRYHAIGEVSELFSLLQNRFSHSLRRMKLDLVLHNHFLFDCDNFPNIPLQTLELTTCPYFSYETPPAIATVSTFFLHWHSGDDIPPWRFPALRHLGLRMANSCDIAEIRPFMDAHGPQLVSLDAVTFSKKTLKDISALLAPSTNLRSLVLPRLPGRWVAGERWPCIIHLGLVVPRLHNLGAILCRPTPLPALQRIRFFGHISLADGEAARVLELGQEWNVRIEDQNGRLIGQGG